MNSLPTVTPEVKAADTQAIAEALIPYFAQDGQRIAYLGYRANGFNQAESRELAGLKGKHSVHTVYRWRKEDELFAYLDGEGLSQLRDMVSRNLLVTKYTRVMRLALDRDEEIYKKAQKGVELSDKEHDYLMKVRPLYSGQGFKAMVESLQPDAGEEKKQFNFTEMIYRTADDGEIIVRSGIGNSSA